MAKKITPIIVTVDTVDELPPPPPTGFGGNDPAAATHSECDCEMCRRNADGVWHNRRESFGGGC